MKTIEIIDLAKVLKRSAEKLEEIKDSADDIDEIDDLIADIHSAYRRFMYEEWN